VQSPRIAPAEGSSPDQLSIFRTVRRAPDLSKGQVLVVDGLSALTEERHAEERT